MDIEMNRIISWLFGILCLAAIGFGGWKVFESRKTEIAAPEAPKVTVDNPVVKDVIRYEYFTGTTSAIASVEVRTRLEGFLDSVEFKPSSHVKKNDVLFVVEPEKYRAQRDEGAARLNASKAELIKAQSELERVEQAIKSQAVSEQEVTSKRALRDQADAAVKASIAFLEKAELEYSYTQIRTPIDGRVSRNLVDAGNLVGAGENTLLTTVVTLDPMDVYFNISERIILELISEHDGEAPSKKEDYKFSINLANEEDYSRSGVLDFIDNVVDPSTGTITVRGVVDNKDKNILPGMFVRVRLPVGIEKDAIVVKEEALGTDIGGKYLMVVGQDDIVEQRPVKIGLLLDGMRVIKEGLTGGELYITNGLLRARPGMPVKFEHKVQANVCEHCQSEIALNTKN